MSIIAYRSGASHALVKLGFSPVWDLAAPIGLGAGWGATQGALEELPEGVDRNQQIRARALQDATLAPLIGGIAMGGGRLARRAAASRGAELPGKMMAEGFGGLGTLAGLAGAGYHFDAMPKLDRLFGVHSEGNPLVEPELPSS